MAASSSSSSQASYGRRNIFYLRVSPYLVLPCILYIDPRHVLWLNTHPSTMPATLKFLKGRIMDKLEREAKVKKWKQDGQNWEKKIWGDISADFHLAYFFRRQTDRHAVLVKEKEKVFPSAQGRYRQPTSAKRPRQTAYDDEDDDGLGAGAGPSASRLRSEQGEVGDVQIKPDPEDEDDAERCLLGDSRDDRAGVTFAVPDEEEEMEDVKPKFKLKVKYRDFTIFTKSLIIVLEPSPAARARSPDLFLSQQSAERRQLSVTPAVGAGVSAGTLYSRSSSQRGSRDPRGMREDSTASTIAGSRRDARTGSTPLFRGSMTPSEAGDTPEGDASRFDWSPSPSPVPRSPRASRAGGEGDGDAQGERLDAEGEAEAEAGESAFLLAERILTQDGGAGGAEGRLEGRDSVAYGYGGGEDE
ncbi:hypothetical protein BCV69DRAFT_299431 [Microstroma glucosiphilum]|uniref:Uncharacterized protein n=1 Tax=Pseudomicrostroma glucosiphilum TaxID=1684307 RepID=A0A316U4Y8_9BASI|nr:hypothetical protein BCV69DRAFT_299431 [Pseudomicrostroma glucosiphilum]PWN20296.1 hypothetical protein BCV69DRAFT_299431 [Pseudomicrostroma glucosiphilum]